ncbi:hypothetical protein [Stenotrophomonas lactitubi]|uniref:hypothetical protein n=1 Tax=Stenotrophomonas lactitubi TaxID=2045214 RepID=UPI00387724B5
MAWIYLGYAEWIPVMHGCDANRVDPRHAWMGLADHLSARAQKKTRCLRSGFPVLLPVGLPGMAWHY